MNTYCTNALHQIEVAVMSLIAVMDKLEESDLEIRPTQGKYSAGELLRHIAVICRADVLISMEASEKEMSRYYESVEMNNLKEIQAELLGNYSSLVQLYHDMTEEDLHAKKTSYWGVVYSRYEWLLQISSHLYHHRGQLHAMLVHCGQKDPAVPLFE
ncbi:DinB family protein [Paenibacillus lemnae]|uniref:DinB family protein n=1 Tax=Paenibacillus lemnae TaxID=1330551 RepID=A0A848M8X8_PAELE|nr:DinB family protein [Paenibacillus lemnae]NMO96343.1 DinB family protein [Paenibacillus lemnae]